MSVQIQVLCLAFFSLWPTKWHNPVQACHVIQETHEVLQQLGADYEIELLVALFKKESNFKAYLGPNKAGACGLGQQIPAYTRYYSDKQYTCREIKDSKTSIRLTVQALNYLHDKSKEKTNNRNYKIPPTEEGLYHALCMYSQGTRSNCDNWRGVHYGTSYTRTVIKWRDQLKKRKQEIASCLQKETCEMEFEFPEALPITIVNDYPTHVYGVE